jgi:hypothetical protein
MSRPESGNSQFRNQSSQPKTFARTVEIGAEIVNSARQLQTLDFVGLVLEFRKNT